MKSKFKIGDKVKDKDGDIGIVRHIYERDEAPNQIEVFYGTGVYSLIYECELEKCERRK